MDSPSGSIGTLPRALIAVEPSAEMRLSNPASPASDPKRLDEDAVWRAVETRDRGLDGQVYYAVKTTGIYCLPSCPARKPNRSNVFFYASAAEA